IPRNMCVARPVTGLARNAELNRLGIDRLRRERLRSERGAELGSAQRRVALDADAVPASALRNQRGTGRMHHRRLSWNPPILADEPNRRKLTEQSTVPRGVPIN